MDGFPSEDFARQVRRRRRRKGRRGLLYLGIFLIGVYPPTQWIPFAGGNSAGWAGSVNWHLVAFAGAGLSTLWSITGLLGLFAGAYSARATPTSEFRYKGINNDGATQANLRRRGL